MLNHVVSHFKKRPCKRISHISEARRFCSFAKARFKRMKFDFVSPIFADNGKKFYVPC